MRPSLFATQPCQKFLNTCSLVFFALSLDPRFGVVFPVKEMKLAFLRSPTLCSAAPGVISNQNVLCISSLKAAILTHGVFLQRQVPSTPEPMQHATIFPSSPFVRDFVNSSPVGPVRKKEPFGEGVETSLTKHAKLHPGCSRPRPRPYFCDVHSCKMRVQNSHIIVLHTSVC